MKFFILFSWTLFFSWPLFAEQGQFAEIPNGFSQNAQYRMLRISVLNYAQARSLFQDFLAHQEIPFRYPVDGCFARAHAMALIAEKHSVYVGKVVAHGYLVAHTGLRRYPIVTWGWHIAPLLYISNERGDLVLSVLDPSLFSKPVSVGQWQARMLTHISGMGRPYISKVYDGARFQYLSRLDEGFKSHWHEADITNAYSVMSHFAPYQDGTTVAQSTPSAFKYQKIQAVIEEVRKGSDGSIAVLLSQHPSFYRLSKTQLQNNQFKVGQAVSIELNPQTAQIFSILALPP